MELQVIENLIYEIRGQKVMLDRDLADLYGVETRALNQAVKRNTDRFPDDFMFQLTKEEWDFLKSQIVILKKGKGKHPKFMPYVFTELGVSMLSSVLNSKAAIQINMIIMRAFVAIRQLVLSNPSDKITELQKEVKELKQYIENAFTDYNDINEDTRIQIELINQSLAELQAQKRILDKPRNPIGYTAPQYHSKIED